MRRSLAWLLTGVLAAGGTLAAHDLAYRLAGRPSGDLHAYLAHAPQLVLVLVTLAVCALALARGAPTPAAWRFPVLALLAFVAQEHLERLAHTGQLPLLLGDPTFLLGLLLQVPFAVAAWALARALLRALSTGLPNASRLPSHLTPVPTRPHSALARRVAAATQARAPPRLLRPC